MNALSPSESGVLTLPVDSQDYIRGVPGVPVTLVEYADFECLHCRRAFPILQQLAGDMPDDLRIVFRHFPLGWEHPHAMDAALAATASASQGKFWEMHDLLFRHQDALDREALRVYAEDLRLDMDRFDRAMVAPATRARVERDAASGRQSGVRGTPSFFINGAIYREAWDLDALSAAITATARRARG